MISKYYNIAKNRLFLLNRSLTGQGVLKTLKIIKKEFPKLKIKKIKSGTKAFDWKIPEEWNVKDAYVLDKNNKKIIDFRKNNLHLLGYSIPIKKLLNKKDFLESLYYLKNQPTAIPYVTSYYKRRWGFSISYNHYKKIKKDYSSRDKFRIIIDSKLNTKGNLTYGEIILKGKSKQEIMISTYICHPSMANNELSGPIVSMGLINYFKKKKLNKTLRFIFIPETIGSISYLSKNLKMLKQNVIGGFNLSCIGDERQHSCMFSKYQNSPSDYALKEAYEKLKIKNYKVYSFLKRGSDERQFNSPGIDLPISSIFRTKYGEYPEYHTSLDNFKIVTLKGVKGGFDVAKKSIQILQETIYPKSRIFCEPQLSKRGLYETLSLKNNLYESKKFLDFIQYSDGKNSIKNISKNIKLNFKVSMSIYKKLKKLKLIY